MFNMEGLQGMMITNDLMTAQFALSNEAIVFLNTSQVITKMNKTSELLFNKPVETAVGLQLAEFLGTGNNHFMQVMAAITNRGSEAEPEEGVIGKTDKPLEPHHIC